MTHGVETTEFRREFDLETNRLLRKRLVLFIAIWVGLGLLGNVPVWVVSIMNATGQASPWMTEVLSEWSRRDYVWYFVFLGGWFAGYISVLVSVLRVRRNRNLLLLLSQLLVVLDGLVAIAFRVTDHPMLHGLFVFAISHLVASIVFPWSPRQAITPAAVVLILSAAMRLGVEPRLDGEDNALTAATYWQIGLSPLLAVPGVLNCMLRHSRRVEKFSYSFIQRRYGSLRQELQYAKTVHESMFPAERHDGSVRMTYRYEPMQQIGGDYLFTALAPTEDGRDKRLSVVVLDVTGHGIPAALTVNRLHGEIELMFADDPCVGPGEVLRRLNRYVNLTLARHSIYATGLCLRVDPVAGTVEYASGGHPPAFVLGADGTVDQLECTSVVLGALSDRDFDPAPCVRALGPGDAVIAYTDGATEARDDHGAMLQIAGFRGLVAASSVTPAGERAARILDAVAGHRDGRPAEDDTLVVEVFRPAGMKSGPAAVDDDAASLAGERRTAQQQNKPKRAPVGV